MRIRLRINGVPEEVDVDPQTPLLWVLRDHLGLKGTKFGCGVAQCGACTVHVDGQARRSCAVPVASLKEQEVTTIEGLEGKIAEALFGAWTEGEVPQCGYCQPGQIMTAAALLTEIPKPDRPAIEGAMVGNVCRCATYDRIRKAIQSASLRLEV